VARGILDFLPEESPFVAALDDTLLKKTGTKTPGVAYRRDPLSPPFHTNFIRGQRFIQLSGLLPAGDFPGPAWAIPLRFEHVPPVPKPKRSAPSEEWKATLAVASYAILLLAAARAFEPDTAHGTLPPPKWRMNQPKQRLSIQELVRQLRSEAWAYAIDQLDANSDDFVTTVPTDTKPLKLNLPLKSALLYADTG